MIRPTILFLFSSAAVFVAAMSSVLHFEQRLRGEPPCRGQMTGYQRLPRQESDAIVDFKKEMKSFNSRLEAQELENEHLKYEMKIKDTQIEALNNVMFKRNLHLGGTPSHAFSAYMDESTYVSANQILLFNKAVLNDGNNYQVDTGVFTAPQDGVYVFSFFISTKNKEQKIEVKLVVNSATESNAIVNTEHPGMQSQGGNVVVVQLKGGSRVSINAVNGGNVVSGESNRVSTFSGFMLY